MASLEDILTTLKNVPKALSDLGAIWRRGQGNVTTDNLAGLASYFILDAPCRVVSVQVITATTNYGLIYDLSSTENIPGIISNRIRYYIPPTAGSYPVSIELTHGLTLLIGTGMQASVTYYQGS